MRKLALHFVLIFVFVGVLLTACRFLQAAGEATGHAPATPEAREAAKQADDAFLNWWNLIFGGGAAAAGVAAGRRGKRRMNEDIAELWEMIDHWSSTIPGTAESVKKLKARRPPPKRPRAS